MSSSSSTGGAVISAESDMPVWAMDNSKCAVCECKFTVFNHRHRCRCCQHPVCNSCAGSRKVLRAYRPPSRVCDACITLNWTSVDWGGRSRHGSMGMEDGAIASPASPAGLQHSALETEGPVASSPPEPLAEFRTTSAENHVFLDTRRPEWGAVREDSGVHENSIAYTASRVVIHAQPSNGRRLGKVDVASLYLLAGFGLMAASVCSGIAAVYLG